MSGLFSPPAGGGDIVKPESLLGHLLICRPIDFKPEFPTSFGNTDAISTDIADLSEADMAGQPKVFRGVLMFNKGIVSALKSEIGKMVLARMTQGVAKPGQSAPWLLADATQDGQAVATATAFLQANPDFQGLAPPSPIRPETSAQMPPATAPVHPGVGAGTVPAMSPYVPPVPAAASAAPAVPEMTLTNIPTGGAPATPGLPEGVSPEAWELIRQMQMTGQMPGANAAH